jgi:hypothetical protein
VHAVQADADLALRLLLDDVDGVALADGHEGGRKARTDQD